MDDYIRMQTRINSGINPIPSDMKKPPVSLEKQGFGNILQEKIHQRDLKISAHAKMRMNTRNIYLSDDDMVALRGAVDKAEQKGVKETLVLMKDNAFVVSVKNRTVITALDGRTIKDNVFTNIDGAVVL